MAKELLSVTLFGLIGWLLCAIIMGVGLSIASLGITLWIHALSVPLIFGSLAFVHFNRFRRRNPLVTALVFLGVVILMDVVVVAYYIEGSFEMFGSILGTWAPFGLIFLSTYLVGLFASGRLPRRLDFFY